MPGLGLFWDAFISLIHCRSMGFGDEGGIWWDSVDRYAQRYGLHGEQRLDLFYHVNALDEAYREHRRPKDKPKPPPPRAKGKGKKR